MKVLDTVTKTGMELVILLWNCFLQPASFWAQVNRKSMREFNASEREEVARISGDFLRCLMWGWVFLEQTRILSRFQFTRHFIEFVFVETKPFVFGSIFHSSIKYFLVCIFLMGPVYPHDFIWTGGSLREREREPELMECNSNHGPETQCPRMGTHEAGRFCSTDQSNSCIFHKIALEKSLVSTTPTGKIVKTKAMCF